MKQHNVSLLSLICTLLILHNHKIFGQTTNISGIINTYYSVSAIDPANETLTLNGPATAFNTNDEILIIQMQGGSIDETNTANFGNITNLSSTGLFERATVCSSSGNDLTLQNSLANSYDDPATSNSIIQVIKFTSYIDVNVNGTLTAPSWDGSTGGVCVLVANGTVSLNADINLNGIGFRGGLRETMNSGCASFPWPRYNAYFYSQADQSGSKKGEGVIPFINLKDYGRGPQANGGGGGNEHNAGGAGGGNFGTGGQGGEKTTGGTFSCVGNRPGIGGKNVQAYVASSNIMIMGGGGGAGNDNDGQSVDAGNGGGILILIADQIEGNGFSISARGESAGIAVGDAGSGGGAGGSLLFSTNGYGSTPLNLDVSGGNGGNTGIAANCLGPGGGGGGGYIRAATPLSANVNSVANGGAAGIVSLGVTLACAGGNNFATAGAGGAIFTGATIPQSGSSSSCVLAARPENNQEGESPATKWMEVFPNPLARGESLKISLLLNEKSWVLVELMDIQGKKSYKLDTSFEKGERVLEIPTQDLAPGLYILRTLLNGQQFTKNIQIRGT